MNRKLAALRARRGGGPSKQPAVLGIDPGLDGGLAFLGPPGALLHITPTLKAKGSARRTFDTHAMVALLKARPLDLVVLEAVQAAPVHGRRQGTTSMFRFGQGYGLWLGMLAALEIPHQLVTPQTWKAAILAGTAKDKQAAIEFVQRRHPTLDLRATTRARNPHDGLADAVCLAEYGCRLLRSKP